VHASLDMISIRQSLEGPPGEMGGPPGQIVLVGLSDRAGTAPNEHRARALGAIRTVEKLSQSPGQRL